MEKKCPFCGTVSVSTQYTVKNRRVWGCANLLCGCYYIRYKGKILVITIPFIFSEDNNDLELSN